MIKITRLLKNNILLLIILSFASCKEKKHEKVDKLLTLSQKSYNNYENIKAFNYALEAKTISQKAENSADIAKSYYQLAFISSEMGLQKESLYYISKAYEQKYTLSDKLLQAKLKIVKSANYYTAELYSQDIRELFGALKLIEKDNNTQSNITKAQIYREIGGYYENTKGDFDSAYIYYKLTQFEFDKISERLVYSDLSNFYIRLGTISIKKNDNDKINEKNKKDNYDQSLIFYKKALAISKKYKATTLQTEYQALGDYFYSTDQYPQALDYYLKSLKEKQPAADPYALRTYRNISELYEILGDNVNRDKYKEIFETKVRNDESRNAKNMDFIVKAILKDQQTENSQHQNKSFTLLSIGILILFLSLFFIYRVLRKKLKQKEEKISEVTTTLEQKEKVIFEKNQETKELKIKVNDTYNELIELAKNNDPAFYFRFQEIYPEFHNTLLKNFPGLRNTELILCAYTFLGFSIKDVAEYTFKSVNTIRNRKQNLRKKFGVPTDKDMGVWLKNLIYPNNSE
ncbi:tetratricopeptide repeat protein [Chryseobacterium sp. C39-AII1]|uniref:tetratricopeptide repeat protein n=1 Tax=Chryseobacterium sp. C39-AII1 TaxID=3080332 RepID=UPI00320B2AEB